MEFRGPEPADFANVHSLNKAFLRYLCRSTGGERLRRQLSPLTEPLVTGLTTLQIRRLSKAPFLLFSLRELDDAYWSDIFADPTTGDLFTPSATSSTECDQLVAAALAFLWQLSTRNPYAVRIISGASVSWCERLSEVTVVQLLQRTAGRGELLVLRLADNTNLWKKLLVAGISSETDVRAAAQQCALQTMLTNANNAPYRALPAAACHVPVPALQVAEGKRRLARRKKS